MPEIGQKQRCCSCVRRGVRGRRQKHLYNLHFHFSASAAASASVSHANERANSCCNSCSIRIHKILFELRANISRSRAASTGSRHRRHTRKLPHATWHNDSHCPPVCLSFAHSINSSRELQGAPLCGALISRQQLNIYIEIVSSTFLRTEFLIAHFCHKFLMREGERWRSLPLGYTYVSTPLVSLARGKANGNGNCSWNPRSSRTIYSGRDSMMAFALSLYDPSSSRYLEYTTRFSCGFFDCTGPGDGDCAAAAPAALNVEVAIVSLFLSLDSSLSLTRLDFSFLYKCYYYFYYYFYTRLQCISVYLVRHFA